MRPSFIKHVSEIERTAEQAGSYKGSRETFTDAASFSDVFGFTRFGVVHEILAPGKRSSWPHAHEREDEFIFVIDGTPDLWIDGTLHRLGPGDSVGLSAGTGIAHVLINNSEAPVRFIVVGDRSPEPTKDRVHYPRHGALNAARGPRHWPDEERPAQPDGGHDGLPDRLRENPVD